MKKTSTAKQFLFGGILFATVLAIGCNNAEEKKAETPAAVPATENVPPAATTVPTPPDTTVKVKKDTASTRPTKTPNQ